jgi:hypothetical protein
MNDNNQLITINQNAKSALIKSKDLLDITRNLLMLNNKLINSEDTMLIWKDNNTKLVWEIKSMNNIEKIYTYEEAIEYKNNLNMIEYAGINNWEIPDLEELESLYSEIKHNDLHIKQILSANSDWAYWSCTTQENKNYTYYYNYGEKRLESKKFKCYLRCVSRGKNER